MFEVTIKKQGVVTNGPSPFETLELAEAHVAREEANRSYGKLDRWIHEKELSDEEKIEYTITRKVIVRDAVAAKDAVIDTVTGDILEPAIEAVSEKSHLEHFIPKKYQVIIEDVTARVEQELSKKQQKEQKRLDRIEALQSLDWSTVTNFATIKPVCKLMSEIINDILKEQAGRE